MKKGKRPVGFVLALVLCLALALPVYADVLVEPYGNDFYEKHWEECEFDQALYYANSTQGYIVYYESPLDGKAVWAEENGTRLFVCATYEDSAGVVWGAANYNKDDQWLYGWIPLTELLPIYDGAHFREDHETELTDYADQFRDYPWEEGTDLCFWPYPNAAAPDHVWEDIDADAVSDLTGEDSWFDLVYTDSEGRSWAHLVYFYGSKDVWVCLSDPHARELGGEDVMLGELLPAVTPPEDLSALDAPARSDGLSAPVLVGAFGLLIIAAAVIFWLIRRKKAADAGTSK